MGDTSDRETSNRVQAIATHLSVPEQILETVKGPPKARPEQAQPFVEPRTETERKLAEMWGEVLGLDRVGVQDDFFRLGGHSIMVMHVLSRVRDIFGIELPLSGVFTYAFTIEELAKQIELAEIAGASGDDVTAVLDRIGQLSDEEVDALLARKQPK
jgi:acyl carrier protein